MPQLVALLRGINVGKAKRVVMADLRRLLTDLGYTNPRTLLNSGNAVFGATAAQARSAEATIRRGIAEQLGVDCAVLTRTAGELAATIEHNPFPQATAEPSKFLVGFLSGPVPAHRRQELASADYGADELSFGDGVVYLWCAGGILDSPLSKLAWSSLGVQVTTRNWTTLTKLADLAASS
ncbi:MAG TPA: DUF1697 domain-containing protein [Jatrophihabitans sp.]|nr:DUF1697 domain-containing protein [Jatrophihabitans sp.]